MADDETYHLYWIEDQATPRNSALQHPDDYLPSSLCGKERPPRSERQQREDVAAAIDFDGWWCLATLVPRESCWYDEFAGLGSGEFLVLRVKRNGWPMSEMSNDWNADNPQSPDPVRSHNDMTDDDIFGRLIVRYPVE